LKNYKGQVSEIGLFVAALGSTIIRTAVFLIGTTITLTTVTTISAFGCVFASSQVMSEDCLLNRNLSYSSMALAV